MVALKGLTRLLAEPRTRGLDLDDFRNTAERRAILKEKPALRRIYEEWYEEIISDVPPGPGNVLEIGSGPGFLGERIPRLVSSEVFLCSGIRAVLDARWLPVRDGSLRAIVMTDVFHHVPDARFFLREATRALRPGGTVVMIEPWVSRWSRLVYAHLHHEPFLPESTTWELPLGGPLSRANGALPWIVFARDRARFAREFPYLTIRAIAPGLPLRYLFSGGLSMQSLLPAVALRMLEPVESLLGRWPATWAMFARIVLVRS